MTAPRYVAPPEATQMDRYYWLKLTLIVAVWCCMHPFAFAVPLGFAIGTALEWLHHRWCVWRGVR